jgi:hypothetical protein
MAAIKIIKPYDPDNPPPKVYDIKLGMDRVIEGNPGAMTVLRQLFDVHDRFEFHDCERLLEAMDVVGLHGSYVWILFKDICHERIHVFADVIRAMIIGAIDPGVVYNAAHRRYMGVANPGLQLDYLQRAVQTWNSTHPTQPLPPFSYATLNSM